MAFIDIYNFGDKDFEEKVLKKLERLENKIDNLQKSIGSDEEREMLIRKINSMIKQVKRFV